MKRRAASTSKTWAGSASITLGRTLARRQLNRSRAKGVRDASDLDDQSDRRLALSNVHQILNFIQEARNEHDTAKEDIAS